MKLISLLLICICLSSVYSAKNACPKGPLNNVNSSIVSVFAHFVKFDVILAGQRCIEVIYQDSASAGPKFKVTSASASTHNIQIHRLWANTSYDVQVWGRSESQRQLIDTFSVTTLDDIPLIKTFKPQVVIGETTNDITLFTWPVPFGLSRHAYMVAYDSIGQIIFVLDITPSPLTSLFAFSGPGFDYHPTEHKFLVMSTLFLTVWNADGTLHNYGNTCDCHHEASYNKFQVGEHEPYTLAATLVRWANESYNGFTQQQDGIVTWDFLTHAVDIKGYFHSTFGVPYELRDGISNDPDGFIGACAKAPNATSFIRDWLHGNSGHFGSQFFIFNARHAYSTIMLFNHDITKIEYFLGGPQSDFTFIDDRARWSGAHDVQEVYMSPNKKILKLMMFDNGINRTDMTVPYSRGLVIVLDMVHKTIDIESEYRFDYAVGSPCYTSVKGGIERIEDGKTVVTFTYCFGDGGFVSSGKYGYVVQYDKHDVMETVTRVNVIAGPAPLAGGIYRSRVLPTINGEEIIG